VIFCVLYFFSPQETALKQGFSNGDLGPPWGPRSGSPEATSRGLHQVAENKTRYFYWWAGGRKCWEYYAVGNGSWKFENQCVKFTL